MDQSLVSLQDVRDSFENVKEEFELECEMTIPVTISVYRQRDDTGVLLPLHCGIEFHGNEDPTYPATLLNQDGDQADTLEDVVKSFGIQLDAKVWKVSMEDYSLTED